MYMVTSSRYCSVSYYSPPPSIRIYIRKVSSQLKTKKCRDFATSRLNYIESFWLKLDLNIWNMFKVKTRTNNLAEGYNYALGSKKIISKHPNPYTHQSQTWVHHFFLIIFLHTTFLNS